MGLQADIRKRLSPNEHSLEFEVKQVAIAFGLFSLVSSTLASCAAPPQTTQSSNNRDTKVSSVAVTLRDLGNPFFVQVGKGATQVKTTINGTSDRNRASNRQAWKNFIQVAGILPILLVICIVFSIVSPSFLSPGNLINVIRQASINIVLATGMTFVILTGGIDLSVGSILGVTAVVGVLVSLIPGIGLLAVPAALVAGLCLGLLNGSLIAYLGLPPFIVTLGSYTALRGVAYLVANGTTVINRNLNFAWIGNNYLGPIPWLERRSITRY